MWAPITGASACSERHATSSTVGRSAAESSAETGAGASECASGSQLWTGAQPIFGRQSGEQEQVGDQGRAPRGEGRRKLVPGERRARPSGGPPVEDDDPEQRDAEPERRQDEVLPAGLERPRLAAETDEQRRRGCRGLDEQPGEPEVAGQRDREEDRPEGVEQDEVDARRAGATTSRESAR